LNAYVDGNKSELEKFQQMLSVEGGAEDVFWVLAPIAVIQLNPFGFLQYLQSLGP